MVGFAFARIINDFQNFYTPHKEKHIFELEALLQHAFDFDKALFESQHISVHIDIKERLKLYGNDNEFLQVILAVLHNAYHALLETKKSDRNIVITLTKEGTSALLNIQNNGPKILQEHLPLLFDPYFTTKETTIGSGIGLFMSKKIITESFGGTIEIHNTTEGVSIEIKVKYV